MRKIAAVVSHVSLSSSNGRVNRSISSKWTAPIEVSPGSRQLFRFRKIRFRQEVTLGTMMIRSSRRRHGRDRGGGTLSRPLIYPARWVHQKGSIRWGSPIPSHLSVRSRRYALIIAWLRVLTMTTSATGGVTWHRKNGGPGPFNTDSRRQSLEEAKWDGALSVGDKIAARQKVAVAK